MAKPSGIWGIDIGQCALKALRLELIDGQPTATAFDFIEHAKILSQPDAEPDSLTRETLEKFLSRNPLGTDQVAISIAGQSGLARFVKLPPVEEKKINDIVKFEAKQQIPFPLEEVVWDFQRIAGGETVGGFAMETEIGLFAMKRDIISKHLGHYNSVGAEVHYVQMAPLALCNYATYDLLRRGGSDGVEEGQVLEGEADDTPKGKKRCVVVMDIGTDSSNLIITDGGKVIWQRPIPLGGNHFTKALVKEMKLTFAKAEHLKRNAAKSPDLAQILKSLRPVLTEFVGEVQRSLGYFTNTHRDSHIVYMVGLGSAFKLPGLQKYLSEKLSLDVRKPTTMNRLSGDQVLNDPTFSDNLLTFPVAYGLALQGIGLARLQTNLLPNEVRVSRMVRAKKPAVAAAAAALLLGVGILGIGKGVELSAVSDERIAKAQTEAKSAVDQAKSRDTKFSTEEAAIKTALDEQKAIVVGEDEKLNWIRLQQVLSMALPRHGYIDRQTGQEVANSNLLEQSQIPFWNTNEGQRAYEKLKERLSSGIPIEKLYDDDYSKYLASVNLEAVYARYVDNPQEFLNQAHKQAMDLGSLDITIDLLENEKEKDESVTPAVFKPKAGEGGGWVVELRGYTYYDAANEGATKFLKECLVKNIRKINDKFAAPGAPMVTKILPDVKDPITDNVSHVFLLLSQPGPGTQPNGSPWISASRINGLIGGGAAQGMGGGEGDPGGIPSMGGKGGSSGAPGAVPGMGDAGSMMMMGSGSGAGMGGATGAGPAWTPLMASGSAGGGFGMGMGMPGMSGPGMAMPGMGPAAAGMGGPSMGPAAAGMGSGSPGGAAMSLPGEGTGSSDGGGAPGSLGLEGEPGGSGAAVGGPPTGAVTGRAKAKQRYDFVVCFIWKEPTPTDPTPSAEGGATELGS